MPYLQVPTLKEIEASLLNRVERELPKDQKIEGVELEDTGLQLTITDHVAALQELYADTDWRDYGKNLVQKVNYLELLGK